MSKFKTVEEAYEWCKETGCINKTINVNHELIRTMLKNANTNISAAELIARSINENDPRWMNVYTNYYEAIKIMVKAHIMFDKINISNHVCLFAYICKEHPELNLDWKFFEKIRNKRNDANYYGKNITYKNWKEAEENMKRHIEIMNKDIKERLDS